MITINLAPPEELESPYWYLPDLAAVAVVVILGSFGWDMVLDQTKAEIESLNNEASSYSQSYQEVSSELKRFNDLNKQIEELGQKKRALENITKSKLVRYMPVILLESIQVLKPDGLWVDSIRFFEEGGDNAEGEGIPEAKVISVAPGENYPFSIEILGNSFDNIILSEFLIALKATQNQEFEKDDLRTQIYFSQVDIEYSREKLFARTNNNVDPVRGVSFRILLKVAERSFELSDQSLEIAKYRRAAGGKARF